MECRIVDRIRRKEPLVHCITNHVTANDCANALLSVGARPIMAEHPDETAQITARADALALNLGGISSEKMTAMRNSQKSALENGIPVTLDMVGAAASSVRLDFAKELLLAAPCSIIKGNAAEIMALCGVENVHCGVDSAGVRLDEKSAAQLAQESGAVVLASGAVDFITDGKRMARIKNGCSMMRYVTGMGCVLNSLCGAFLAVAEDAFCAAVFASAALEIAGELTQATGSGSFRVGIMDNLYNITDDIINKRINAELFCI